MIRVGFLGVAHPHAHAYMSALRRRNDVEIIGATERAVMDGSDCYPFTHRYDMRRFVETEQLLDERLDAVIICSENIRHKELVVAASRRGAHILCEKPLAVTADDAREMADFCDKANVKLMTAFPMRFNRHILSARNELQGGKIGELRCIVGVNQGQLPKKHGVWFVDSALSGGGAVIDHTVHLADIIRAIVGADPIEIYAQANRVIHSDESPVETGGLVVLRFADGLYASIDCSWSRPHRYPSWGGLAMTFVGERGIIDVDAFAQNLAVYGLEDSHLLWEAWGSDADQAMIDHFIDAVRDDASLRVDGYDGLAACRVVDAAYRSIATGRPVALSAAKEAPRA